MMTDATTAGAAGSTSALPKHLKRLEAESIQIIREVAAEFKKPVMLYSVGKDTADSIVDHLLLRVVADT